MSQYIGQQLGAYRLTRSLGIGGFAEVYLGKHVQNNWEVAVKVLKINYSAKTFSQEANILWNLRHPHIVEIKEFNTENGISYLVMDYAAKGSLRDVHAVGETLIQQQILTYIKQIADALDFIHNKQPRPLVHCDIKPQNFLMKANGAVLLGDFGIATEAMTDTLRALSLPNAPRPIVGTLHYIAPEQWQGLNPTPATDQYALGVVVYEWLSGRRPFTGTNAQMIALAHTNNPPPPFNDSSISAELEDAVMCALAKDPSQRFPSILDFAQALEDAIQNRPIFPSPQAAPYPKTPPNPIGGGIWGQLQSSHKAAAPPSSSTPPSPTSGYNAPTLPVISPLMNQQAYSQGSTPFTTTTLSKKRKPLRFDWGSLQESNTRLFLLLGGICDFLGIIPLFLSLHDLNWAVGLPLLAIMTRFFCAAALKTAVARPLAWVLTLYETLVVLILLLHLTSSFYILILIVAIVAWLCNDFLYARKK